MAHNFGFGFPRGFGFGDAVPDPEAVMRETMQQAAEAVREAQNAAALASIPPLSQPVPQPLPPQNIGPEDGEYHIRCVPKDRYLDVAYGAKGDNATVIGQTLNPTQTPNQRWTLAGKMNTPTYAIRGVDSGKFLTAHLHAESAGKPLMVVTHADGTAWRLKPIPGKKGHYKLSLEDDAKGRVLSLHRSASWDVILAEDEDEREEGRYHQVWEFVRDPYARK